MRTRRDLLRMNGIIYCKTNYFKEVYVELTTKRLKIRPFKQADINDLFEIYSNEETCQYLLHEPWTDNNKNNEFQKISEYKLTTETAISLAYELDNKVVGDISIWYTGMKETVEVGFAFNSNFAGKGYATEALRGVIEYLFAVEKVHRIQANLDCRNNPSSHLCARVGMRQEAHFIKDFWNKGEWTDSYVYGMLKSDFNN